MQKKKKSAVIIYSLVVMLFLCLIIVLVVQFTKIKQMQSSLENINNLTEVQQETLSEVNAEIEYKSSDNYVEKWARENLGWIFENEIKIII